MINFREQELRDAFHTIGVQVLGQAYMAGVEDRNT